MFYDLLMTVLRTDCSVSDFRCARGPVLREHREFAGVSIVDFASAVSVSSSTAKGFETRGQDWTVLRRSCVPRICALLGWPASYLRDPKWFMDLALNGSWCAVVDAYVRRGDGGGRFPVPALMAELAASDHPLAPRLQGYMGLPEPRPLAAEEAAALASILSLSPESLTYALPEVDQRVRRLTEAFALRVRAHMVDCGMDERDLAAASAQRAHDIERLLRRNTASTRVLCAVASGLGLPFTNLLPQGEPCTRR